MKSKGDVLLFLYLKPKDCGSVVLKIIMADLSLFLERFDSTQSTNQKTQVEQKN